ncbi:MAG: HD domain-containing protein [Candidatus Omnitrophica bacterium]|nr:HD domain-containing protein [Candidatus Omnitrophota bacterium]
MAGYLFKFSRLEKTLLREILRFAQANKVRLYLVGGILRDSLLGRKKDNLDFDFCLKRNAVSFGRKLAHHLNAGFVVLDKEHGSCRLVKKTKKAIYTFDFTDFRGRTLEEDLLRRDFTINAIALALDEAFSNEAPDFLIDPFHGRRDLEKKVVAVVHKDAFSEDPLRILRAFSLAVMLGFVVDRKTMELAKKERKKLGGVSCERVREELFRIMHSDSSYACLKQLSDLGILEIIFPEIKKMRGIGQGPYHHLDVWGHTLETVRQLDILLKDMQSNVQIDQYLKECVSAERRRIALLKLAAFLHDFGKPATFRHIKGRTTFHGHERTGLKIAQEIARRLKLSNAETAALGKMVLYHLRPGYLADSEYPTERAKFRYFRDTEDEALGTLLLSLADQRATKGPLTTRKARLQHERVVGRLIQEYLGKKGKKEPRRLITGDDLIRVFGLEPSPLIGKILKKMKELQAIGKVKTKEEALRCAQKML